MYICLLVIIISSLINQKFGLAYAFRSFDVGDESLFLVMENETIDLECKDDMSMAYCGFSHPMGKRFSFSGRELYNGRCIIRLNVTKEDEGEWKCHIGKNHIGLEIMQKIQVKLTNQLAALHENITVKNGQSATLRCVTTKKSMPIRYCRFEPPNGAPFSIDSSVNHTKAIANKYYYPSLLSLDRGDCAVTIKKVKDIDAGVWTCGAGFDDDREYVDEIKITVEAFPSKMTMIFGAIIGVLLLIFIALGTWAARNRYCCNTRRTRRRTEEQEMVPLRTGGEQVLRERVPLRIPTIIVQSPSNPDEDIVLSKPLSPSAPALSSSFEESQSSRPSKPRPRSWTGPISSITQLDPQTNSPVTIILRQKKFTP